MSQDVAERWYLRIDDKEYGPVSRSEMEEFLRPPHICSSLQIMCSVDQGKWHTIGRSEGIDKVLLRFGIQDVSAVEPQVVNRESSASFNEELGLRIISMFTSAFSFVARFRAEIVILLAIVAVNLGMVYFTSDGKNRDRQILQQLETIWDAAGEFNNSDDSDGEWRVFADQAINQIQPLIVELKRTASPRQPARQALMFAARDGLINLLQGQTPAGIDTEVGTVIQVRLHQAHKLLVDK